MLSQPNLYIMSGKLTQKWFTSISRGLTVAINHKTEYDERCWVEILVKVVNNDNLGTKVILFSFLNKIIVNL